jgi:hypothetical protein
MNELIDVGRSPPVPHPLNPPLILQNLRIDIRKTELFNPEIFLFPELLFFYSLPIGLIKSLALVKINLTGLFRRNSYSRYYSEILNLFENPPKHNTKKCIQMIHSFMAAFVYKNIINKTNLKLMSLLNYGMFRAFWLGSVRFDKNTNRSHL